jgi:hypothetical protein
MVAIVRPVAFRTKQLHKANTTKPLAKGKNQGEFTLFALPTFRTQNFWAEILVEIGRTAVGSAERCLYSST